MAQNIPYGSYGIARHTSQEQEGEWATRRKDSTPQEKVKKVKRYPTRGSETLEKEQKRKEHNTEKR